MTQPLSPPTVSGWYVVEWQHNDYHPFLKIEVRDDGTFVSEDGFRFHPWSDYAENSVTRFSGPLDLQALLEGKNK